MSMIQKILTWRTGVVIWEGEAACVNDAIYLALASGADLTGADLTGANLSGAHLSGAYLSSANLTGANLSGANLRRADLSGTNLRRADLSGTNLTGADLRRANLSGANLSGANLRRANLRDADLRDADLTGANLSGAYLSGAYLSGAYLSGADLSSAYLSGAYLSGAYLSGAYLSGANLSGADLTGANLRLIRDDFWAVLNAAAAEVPALIAALKKGRVDGSTYQGSCACLVGTIANARGCDYRLLSPNASRPAERFFLAIEPGDTPETNPCAKLAVEWAEAWLTRVCLQATTENSSLVVMSSEAGDDR